MRHNNRFGIVVLKSIPDTERQTDSGLWIVPSREKILSGTDSRGHNETLKRGDKTITESVAMHGFSHYTLREMPTPECVSRKLLHEPRGNGMSTAHIPTSSVKEGARIWFQYGKWENMRMHGAAWHDGGDEYCDMPSVTIVAFKDDTVSKATPIGNCLHLVPVPDSNRIKMGLVAGNTHMVVPHCGYVVNKGPGCTDMFDIGDIVVFDGSSGFIESCGHVDGWHKTSFIMPEEKIVCKNPKGIERHLDIFAAIDDMMLQSAQINAYAHDADAEADAQDQEYYEYLWKKQNKIARR